MARASRIYLFVNKITGQPIVGFTVKYEAKNYLLKQFTDQSRQNVLCYTGPDGGIWGTRRKIELREMEEVDQKFFLEGK